MGRVQGELARGSEAGEEQSRIPAPFPAPCFLPGAATGRLMKREEAGRGLGQQETARGQCEAGGGWPSGRDRQCPHMGSRRSCPAPPWSRASALSQEKEQKEGSSQFSKCPKEDATGGVVPEAHPWPSRVYTHTHTQASHFLVFLNIFLFHHSPCPKQRSKQYQSMQSKIRKFSHSPQSPRPCPLTSSFRSN